MSRSRDVKIQVNHAVRIMGKKKNISGQWYVVRLILIGHYGKESGL